MGWTWEKAKGYLRKRGDKDSGSGGYGQSAWEAERWELSCNVFRYRC